MRPAESFSHSTPLPQPDMKDIEGPREKLRTEAGSVENDWGVGVWARGLLILRHPGWKQQGPSRSQREEYREPCKAQGACCQTAAAAAAAAAGLILATRAFCDRTKGASAQQQSRLLQSSASAHRQLPDAMGLTAQANVHLQPGPWFASSCSDPFTSSSPQKPGPAKQQGQRLRVCTPLSGTGTWRLTGRLCAAGRAGSQGGGGGQGQGGE